MAIIAVPKPSKEAMNPNRPTNCLLLAQLRHLQQAECHLPVKYRSEIYAHAIRTEGEAARYIREVTEAIHKAHAEAGAKRAQHERLAKRPSGSKGKRTKRRKAK